MEDKVSSTNSLNPFSSGEHVDCEDEVKQWLNAIVIGLKPNEIYITYSGWSSKFDEWIPVDSPWVVKQWNGEGMPVVNNRLDVLDERKEWLEARVIEVDGEFIKIHYKGFVAKYDERIRLPSERVCPISSKSKSYGPLNKGKSDDNSDENLTNEQEEEFETWKRKEESFEKLLNTINLQIHEVDGDGNCLFRAVAHSLYGDEEYHDLVREKTMDYIVKNRDFYESYVSIDFDCYVEFKRKLATWGDDLEIQALSELYGRPITIYAYSTDPLWWLGEQENSDIEPIRISYHNWSHYNAVVNKDND